MIPVLLRFIQDAERRSGELTEDECVGLVLTMYLLAQFRERSALPVIVSFFSRPGEEPLDGAADFVTEALPSVLASVAGESWSALMPLAEDETVYEYTRAAAVEAMGILFQQGFIPRRKLLAFFRRLHKLELQREPTYLWTAMACAAADHHLVELEEEMIEGFEEGLLLEIIESPESMLGRLHEDSVPEVKETLSDTIAETSSWPFWDEVSSSAPSAQPDPNRRTRQKKKQARKGQKRARKASRRS